MKSLSDFGNRRWWRSLLLAIGAAMTLTTGETNAADFSTTNIETLDSFWAAAESTNRPVTVVSFGDSMADSSRSVSFHLMNQLTARLGTAGYSLNNYGNTAMWQTTNNAFQIHGGPFWFTDYFQVSPNSAVWWNNQPTPGGVYCDQLGLYYVTQAAGGQFRLLLSTNGGPWTPALVIDGYTTTPTGHFTNIFLPPNRYRLRVEGDAGTNYVIAPSALLTQTGGVHAVFVDLWGIHIGQITNVPLTIRQPIFAALNPDLIIWHMKEDGTLSTSNRMEECENWWKAAAPNTAVVYIGTPWISLDLDAGSTWTPDQNTIVRNIALRHHRAYADLMQPTVSYPWLVSNGFMLDGTHLNSVGGLYCANLLWNDVGFFALGLNRRLTLQRNGAQMQLSYDTSANARYRLEFSTNLSHWTAILTNPVATASFTTNFPMTTAPAFYRLGLTPP